MSNAEARLALINAHVAKAAAIAGRSAATTTLIAVSKTRSTDEISPLIEAGHRHFGENRVQEAQAKWPVLMACASDLHLHLVGQLQSNKAAEAVELFGTIHSVDRPSLVTAIANAQRKLGKRPACFIQVNLADEDQKGGCAVEDLPRLLRLASDSELSIVGLMTVPPAALEPAPWFALLAKLASKNGLAGLSMGMSSDFETAVKLGATHVRVGTALFGPRE